MNHAAWLDEGKVKAVSWRFAQQAGLLLVALLLLSAPVSLRCQEPPIPLPGQETKPADQSPGKSLQWNFSGYLENTLNAEYLRGEKRGVVLNNSRLRLNLGGNLDPHIDFGVTLIGLLNAGTTRVNLFQYMPMSGPSQTIPVAPDLFQYEFKNDLYLQEAFGTLYLGGFKLRVGRHKFYSGTGYAFNPIDLFNRKDPLDPTYEVDGLDAVLASFELPHQTEIQGSVRFGNDFDTADYQARLTTYVRGWDLAFQYTNHTKRCTDWEALNIEQAPAPLSQGEPFGSFERDFIWRLVAAEFAGELWGVAFHGEGGYAFVEAPSDVGTLTQAAKNHERFLLGLDYTLESQLYVMAEYMRLGQGRNEASKITLNDRMAYLTGEVLAINRDTIFTGASYPITPLAELSLYGIVGCNDPSMILNPWLTWSLRPALKLSVSAALSVGSRNGQNGNLGPGGLVRLRYSF